MTLNCIFIVGNLKEFLCNIISPNIPNNSIDTLNKNQLHLKFDNSRWTQPSGRHQTLDHYIECFIKQSHEEINKLKKIVRQHNHKESKSTPSLKLNENIIIKPANKGGAIVIFNRSD